MQVSKFLALLALLALAFTAIVSAQSWNDADSKVALRLSWAAYCPPQQVSSWTCYWCKYSGTPALSMIGTTIDGGTATMAYVGYSGKTIYVVFRGTTNLKNVLLDALITKEVVWSDKPNVKAHGGFRRGYSNLSGGVRGNIASARSRCPGCTRVIFTGHSLGGALATIAAVDYARSASGIAISSITLGSPRVGNTEFSDYAMAKVPNTIRWTHTIDPVVHLPPKLLGWRHRAREVWQHTETAYRTCSSTNSEDPTCANSKVTIGLNSIKEHSNYGGLPLHSGTCETFSGLSAEDVEAIVAAANFDLATIHAEEELEQANLAIREHDNE